MEAVYGIKMNYESLKEHVPEIERNIRVIKKDTAHPFINYHSRESQK